MISIISTKYIEDYKIKLVFSDQTSGILDFKYLLDVKSSLTIPLEDANYFKTFFIDFGALCWKNGLEFSADSLQQKLAKQNLLNTDKEVA